MAEKKPANEIVLVLSGNEEAFEEYSERHEGRDGKLRLRYPDPSLKDDLAFIEFYESPFRIDRRKSTFNGCFFIDLSAYVEHEDSRRITDLENYVKENSSASYVLYAVVREAGQGMALTEKLRKDLCFPVLLLKGEKVKADSSPVRSFGY
ncbi:MAG: hypothetical protein K5634_05035, partial [Sphaerochaetaceae bacterium]|nr:hypothetical protein [Sphaerochaetaceae bacterium]